MRRALPTAGLVVALYAGVDASGIAAIGVDARDSAPISATPADVPEDQSHDTESAVTIRGGVGDATRSHSAWPCRLVVSKELREFAQLAWDYSETFRNQCRTLGAARAVVIVRSSNETFRAEARIQRADGVTLARIRVRRSARVVELIAHELEHVLEHTEGVRFLMEAGFPGSGVELSGGAYETRRAIDAGHRVAEEVRAATRAYEKARRSPRAEMQGW